MLPLKRGLFLYIFIIKALNCSVLDLINTDQVAHEDVPIGAHGLQLGKVNLFFVFLARKDEVWWQVRG